MSEIDHCWTDQARIIRWFAVEKAISKAAGDLGIYPQIRHELDKMDPNSFNLFRIKQIEQTKTNHDLAAFVDYVQEISSSVERVIFPQSTINNNT